MPCDALALLADLDIDVEVRLRCRRGQWVATILACRGDVVERVSVSRPCSTLGDALADAVADTTSTQSPARTRA